MHGIILAINVCNLTHDILRHYMQGGEDNSEHILLLQVVILVLLVLQGIRLIAKLLVFFFGYYMLIDILPKCLILTHNISLVIYINIMVGICCHTLVSKMLGIEC